MNFRHALGAAMLTAGAIVLPRVGGWAATVTTQPVHLRANPAISARALAPKSPGLGWRTNHFGPHVLYGVIAAIDGATIRLRLRNNRTLSIDATPAIKNGDFSAPLFVGKFICVDGVIANGKFSAMHVARLSNLAVLPNDK